MPIRAYKPVTPGQRKSSVNTFSELTASQPVKRLTRSKRRISGRNHQGKITVRHRSGGAKRRYRIIDFKQQDYDLIGRVQSIEYDPNRSCWIAQIIYTNGKKVYVLAPQGIQVGDTIVCSKQRVEIKIGNRMPLELIPTGTMIFNIELLPGQGGLIARSAGSSAQLMAIEGKYATLKLPSKELRKVHKEAMATIGMLSNPDHRLIRWGKAGRMRHKGVKPTVRGKVMNPVDHPHGGGEGRNPIGLKHPKTPWGKPALGPKTRPAKKISNKFIIKRRTKKNS